MTITITNRIGKPAKKYLEEFKTRFPPFSIQRDVVYNGVVVEVDDDDLEDFTDALEGGGFEYIPDTDDNPGDAPKLPKFSSNKPVYPKSTPKLGRATVRLPRYPKV